jgi:probable HAF family extracellular repeat protein
MLFSGGLIKDLGTLGTGENSVASGINQSAEIVGPSNKVNGGVNHAFLYSSGSIHDLGTLGGLQSNALAINNNGLVVGWAQTATQQLGTQMDAFLYDDHTMHDLGTLGGDASSAYAINSRGQIVGTSNLVPGDSLFHAFLDENGTMTDLNTLVGPSSGWTLVDAT